MPASAQSSPVPASPNSSFTLVPAAALITSPVEEKASEESAKGAFNEAAWIDEDEDAELEEYHDCVAPSSSTSPLPHPQAEASTSESRSTCRTIPKPHSIQEPVFLNVYNLFETTATFFGRLSSSMGFGFHHCGVELYGREWAFSGTVYPEDREQTGVFWTYPRTALPQFFQSIHMGWCAITSKEVKKLIGRLRSAWPRGAYHILNRNCNHFAEELVRRLVSAQVEFPPWVNRVARVGDLLLPDAVVSFFVEQAHERLRQEFQEEELSPMLLEDPEQLRSVPTSWPDPSRSDPPTSDASPSAPPPTEPPG